MSEPRILPGVVAAGGGAVVSGRGVAVKRFFSSLRFRLLSLVLIAVLPVLGLAIYAGHERRQAAVHLTYIPRALYLACRSRGARAHAPQAGEDGVPS